MDAEEKLDHLRDAVNALLECTELNLDELEPETVRTIKYARLILRVTGD